MDPIAPSAERSVEVTPGARAAGVMTLLAEARVTLAADRLDELFLATRRSLESIVDGTAPERPDDWTGWPRPGVPPETLVFLRPIELLVHHRGLGGQMPRDVAAALLETVDQLAAEPRGERTAPRPG